MAQKIVAVYLRHGAVQPERGNYTYRIFLAEDQLDDSNNLVTQRPAGQCWRWTSDKESQSRSIGGRRHGRSKAASHPKPFRIKITSLARRLVTRDNLTE